MKRLAPLLFGFLLLAGCSGAPAGDGTQASSSSAISVSSASDTGKPDVMIDYPMPSSVVSSPLTITGKAKGSWFFEASFPVRLMDDQGNEIATGHASAQGDWMTDQYVPFTARITFVTTRKSGTLILQNDNPSGDPARTKSMELSVHF